MGKGKDKDGSVKVTLKAKLGSIGFGKDTARVGFTIDRADLAITKADALLCASRLEVRLVLSDAPGEPLLKDAVPCLESIADSKRLGVGRDSYHGGLTFNVGEIKPAELVRFANASAMLTLERIGDADETSDDGEGE